MSPTCWRGVVLVVMLGWTGLAGSVRPVLAQPAAVAAPAAAGQVENNPLAKEPTTPEEIFDTTLLLVDLSRLDLAKIYLKKFLEQAPDETLLLQLRDKYGTAEFLKLYNIKPLRPESTTLLDAVNAASAKQASDPQRLSQLVRALGSGGAERIEALTELRNYGIAAIPGLLQLLQSPAQKPQHEIILFAIVQMGEDAIPPLMGALESPNLEFQASVIMALGHLKAEAAVPYLWYPALASEAPGLRAAARQALARILAIAPAQVEKFSSEGVAGRLIDAARESADGQRVWERDLNGNVTVWHWDPTRNTVVRQATSPDQANDYAAVRFSREALLLSPNRRDIQVLYLTLALHQAIKAHKWQPTLPRGPGTLHDVGLSLGPEVMQEVVLNALARGKPAAAIGALKILEQVGTMAQLRGTGTGKSALMTALNYPDPRVQFGAATAILQLDPQTPFPEASRVVNVLHRAMSSKGRPVAVVCDPSVERGTETGGFLKDMGYEPVVTTLGREAFLAAAERTDVELIVLHPNIIRWALTETIANIRADVRTGGIPIVLYGPVELERRMQAHLVYQRLVTYAHLVASGEDFERQVRPFLKQLKTPPMAQQEREEQRNLAVQWVAHIATGRRTKVFDIGPTETTVSDLTAVPELVPSVLDILSELPSRTAQERIAGMVLSQEFEDDLRQTAALKLAFHMQRYGVLVSKQQIAGLHQLWESSPPALSTALATVIGTLKPDNTLIGTRLKEQARRGQ